VVSYGFTFANEGNWPVGTDLTEHFGITKYEEPISLSCGDQVAMHESFQKYTDIENIKNYDNVFVEGEEVVVTEKIHGTNTLHFGVEENGTTNFMAGSHRFQRKEDENSTYWRTFGDNTKDLIEELINENAKTVIVFKEVYGHGVQKGYAYGLRQKISDVVLDIVVDGVYVSYDECKRLCDEHGLQTPPILYRGPYDKEVINEAINGNGKKKTILGEGDNILEGGVIKPVQERWNEEVGRAILKWISDAYYLDKNTTDFH
jgi:RNA ligase (TIGR02306 family)